MPAFDVITRDGAEKETSFRLSLVCASKWKNGIIRARNKNDDIKANNKQAEVVCSGWNRKTTRESEKMSFTARME